MVLRPYDVDDGGGGLYRRIIVQSAILILAAGMLILGTWSADYLQGWQMRRALSQNSVVQDAQRDQRIYDLLTGLRIDMGADRSYIFMFHNGGHWGLGTPIKRMSCTYETVEQGVSKEAADAQGILLSAFPEFMARLSVQTDKPLYHAFHTGKAESFEYFMDIRGSRVTVVSVLVHGSTMVGFIGIDYILEAPAEKEIDAETMLSASGKIGQLLARGLTQDQE